MRDEKILIVEDEAGVRLALRSILEEAGYRVVEVGSGDQAMRVFYAEQPDLAVVDLMLPGQSGMDLCEKIRAMSDVPVIIFSAKRDQDDKLEAFEKGADDYIVKGVGLEELLARVNAVLRRAQASAASGAASDTYADEELYVDFLKREVVVRGGRVDLTPTEFSMLAVLVRDPGRPFTAEQIVRRVWGSDYETADLVKWHVGHMRRKIELNPNKPQLLVTRRGYGYSYVPPRSRRS